MEIEFYVRPDDTKRARKVTMGLENEVVVGNLNTGNHTLRLNQQGIVRVERQVHVLAGREAVVEIPLRVAATVRLSIRFPVEKELGSLHAVIRDAAGVLLWERRIRRLAAMSNPYRTTVPLPLGNATLRCETSTGLVAGQRFQVRDRRKPLSVKVELR